jgi:hypothetical protein
MKNINLYIFFLLVLNSCSSDGGSTINTSPTIPTLSYPPNNLVCISNVVNFKWNPSTDPQKDAIIYQLEIATDNTFLQNLQVISSSSSSIQINLLVGKSYYYRIKATDSKNASSSYSSTNNFYTEGIRLVNYLPFAPELKTPTLNSTQINNSLILSWTAVDADQDALTYDVYFGKTNPPTQKAATDITSSSFTVDATASGVYYWKIVVKDVKGGITVGQIWNFNKQ